MSQIYCIVGKSASGKDTLFKEILRQKGEDLIPVIPYTTRPKRRNEGEGVDYHFATETDLERYRAEGRVIEERQYNTTQGIWRYFTLKFDVEPGRDYILITTLEGAVSIAEQYGRNMVQTVYLTLDDKTRLLRCIDREARQLTPDYAEVCRRFIADQKDFSEEKLAPLPNLHRIDTAQSLADCLKQWEALYTASHS